MATLIATQDPTRTDPDSTITLVFEGRSAFGIDQWAYVPFDVPPGVHRIDVRTSHDRFSVLGVARNVLDLGVFGPAGHDVGNAAGFRGWSGGARAGFSLSSVDATPGYLAGPIDPGRWTLALGPVVLNPLGMGWHAEVKLHRGPPPPSDRIRKCAPDTATTRGSGWYRGDLHVHTVHSDGSCELDETVARASAAGLDFIVSTEHNTSSANREWAGVADGLLVVSGEEVTTRHGHWLAVGLPPDGWVDWRYGPRDGVFARYVCQVRSDGGLVVAAHPSVPLPGSLWEFGFCGVDAMEVWNGRWNVDDEMSLRTWLRLLRNGRRITAVGSSDSHGHHQPVGRPHTVVHAEQFAPGALVDALRFGRCYLAESCAVTVSLTAVADDETAGPGETLVLSDGAEVTITGAVRAAPHTTAAIITDTGCVARATIDGSGVGVVEWTGTAADVRFALIEVRHASRMRMRPMLALTNPVWMERASNADQLDSQPKADNRHHERQRHGAQPDAGELDETRPHVPANDSAPQQIGE